MLWAEDGRGEQLALIEEADLVDVRTLHVPGEDQVGSLRLEKLLDLRDQLVVALALCEQSRPGDVVQLR